MTKDKTVTMSRELAAQLASDDSYVRNAAMYVLRGILAAPVVEHQEPVVAWAFKRKPQSEFGEPGKYVQFPTEDLDQCREGLGIALRPREDYYDWQPLYTSPPAPVAVVPEGWKLVPVEPTMEMLEAMMEWSKVGNVNAYHNILDSAPACLDRVKELNTQPSCCGSCPGGGVIQAADAVKELNQ